MKSKWTPLIIGILFMFFCCIPLVIGAFFFQTRPPGALSDSGYYVRLTKVYYYPGFGLSQAFVIQGADPFSFETIDSTYAKDKAHVYYDGVQVPDADPATFELLDSTYARDSRHVYLNGQIFSNDPANFENVSENIYRDSQYIYWSGESISEDPQNLVVLGNFGFYTYLKDSQTVFVNGNPIHGAKPNTFQVISEGYSRDSEHVFYFDELISTADVTTFEALEQQYARDAVSAYWMGKPIPNSDPASFYILNADFECTADANHTYYQDQLIKGFDPATIPTNAQVNSCDLTTVYFTP